MNSSVAPTGETLQPMQQRLMVLLSVSAWKTVHVQYTLVKGREQLASVSFVCFQIADRLEGQLVQINMH